MKVTIIERQLIEYFCSQSNGKLSSIVNATSDKCDINSALVFATCNRPENIADIAYLLELGANPNHQRRGHFHPLQYCAHRDTLESARLLLEYGADPDKSFIHVQFQNEIEHDIIDVMRLAVDYGASMNHLSNVYAILPPWYIVLRDGRKAVHSKVASLCMMATRPAKRGGALHANILRNIGKHLWSMRWK